MPPPLAPHRYQPMSALSHIRLLKLREASGPNLAYDLIETPLDVAPAYESISYVWGDHKKTHTLALLSTQTVLSITPSLENALLHVCPQSQTGYLWIDQICIDQDNTTERSQQVGIMGKIYSKAQRVLIWLGNGFADL
ncbi:HET-domain-containing protein, partial [Periconia macrospinosa]